MQPGSHDLFPAHRRVLKRGGTNVENSLVTVDYVAAGSERDAALFFSNDPRQGEVTVRAKGYIEP